MNWIKNLCFLLCLSFFVTCSINQPADNSSGIPFIDTGIDSAKWVTIPAGEFLQGQHKHKTTIDYDYEIMRTDVTNAQFATYLSEALQKQAIQVADTGIFAFHPGEPFDNYKHEKEIKAGDWLLMPLGKPGARISFESDSFRVEPGYENHPVVMVTWFGANAFAEFYGWRLPTEIEWEKAARGSDGRVYPWGNEIGRNQANYYSSRHLFAKLFGKRTITTPVGYYNGKKYGDFQTLDSPSAYGLYDMAGNVWQWTGDDYKDTHLHYMRGGSEANYEYNLRTWARNNASPDYYGINVGFRCVREKKPEMNAP
ncbi:MAG: hypothetical protein DWQ05_22275 [Calditrichaeota bacterium]|nr:MAG: hypothetical protein DWQ05_22275 [Calditrichota bacterium]